MFGFFTIYMSVYIYSDVYHIYFWNILYALKRTYTTLIRFIKSTRRSSRKMENICFLFLYRKSELKVWLGMTDYDSDWKTKLFVQFTPNNVPNICFKSRLYVSQTYILFLTDICLKDVYLKIVTYSIRTYICPNSTYIYSVKTKYVVPLIYSY